MVNKESILITGHRNPDMDSVCSAIAYSVLKNKIDKSSRYIPVRCGHLNVSTADFFKKYSIPRPMYCRDAYVHLSDIVTKADVKLDADEPVFKLISLFENGSYPYSVIPLFDKGKFVTLLTRDTISGWFMKTNGGSGRALFDFDIGNIADVVPGKLIKKGTPDKFRAYLSVGAMQIEMMERNLKNLCGKNRVVLVVGNRLDAINVAVRSQVAALVITGMSATDLKIMDFSGFKGTVYLSNSDTAETIRLLYMTAPIRSLPLREFPPVNETMLFDDAKKLLLFKGYKGLPVFAADGKYSGFVTRRNFLEKPQGRFIMVDHNEAEQSIPGIEEMQVVEIIDHHRFAMEKTRNPIFLCAEPIGSTCTIVFQMFKRYGVKIDGKTALVMLGGIMSDTVSLKSPTTTENDRFAVDTLSRIAGITADEIAKTLASSSVKFDMLPVDKTILSDFKTYSEKNTSFAIGQCEVPERPSADSPKVHEFIAGLEKVCREKTLFWAMLLVSDVNKGSSVLISPENSFTSRLQYKKIAPGVWDLPDVLSRKKQLLPEIIRTIEEDV